MHIFLSVYIVKLVSYKSPWENLRNKSPSNYWTQLYPYSYFMSHICTSGSKFFNNSYLLLLTILLPTRENRKHTYQRTITSNKTSLRTTHKSTKATDISTVSFRTITHSHKSSIVINGTTIFPLTTHCSLVDVTHQKLSQIINNNFIN